MSAASPRSNFVTALAWVFIVLAGFATLISLMQNLMVHLMMPSLDIPPPPSGGPGMPAWAGFVFQSFRWIVLLFFVLCAAMLAAAIGLLRRRNWARIVFIVMMVFGIVWNLGGMIVMYFIFSSMPPMPPVPQPPGFAPNFELMMKVMTAVNVLIALGVSVLFGWIIKRLVSPAVRAEFHPPA